MQSCLRPLAPPPCPSPLSLPPAGRRCCCRSWEAGPGHRRRQPLRQRGGERGWAGRCVRSASASKGRGARRGQEAGLDPTPRGGGGRAHAANDVLEGCMRRRVAGRGPAPLCVTRSWPTGARWGRHAVGRRSMTGIREGREGELLSKLLSDNIACVKMLARTGVVLGGIGSCGSDERCT
jgi:hypothetical protein